MTSPTTDRWLTVCATVIALSSLGLSLWSAAKQQQHNKLSVRPLLQASYHEPEGGGSAWKLKNYGLGPAWIVWLEVHIDGRPQRDWNEFLRTLEIDSSDKIQFTLPAGAIYMPGQESLLVSTTDPTTAMRLRRNVKRVTVRSCYCSLYGECWEAGPFALQDVSVCHPESATSLRLHRGF